MRSSATRSRPSRSSPLDAEGQGGARRRPTACSRSGAGAGRARRRLDSPHGRAGARAADARRSVRAVQTREVPSGHGPRDGRGRQVAPRRGVPLGGRRAERGCSRAAACPYGEGITFWPVAEWSIQAAGIADDDAAERARVEARPARGHAGRRSVAAALPGCSACDELGGRGGLPGGPPAPRVAARRRPLVARLRRHPLGRADAARPHRAHRRLVRGTADPPGLPGPAGAAGAPAGLGRREAQRDLVPLEPLPEPRPTT